MAESYDRSDEGTHPSGPDTWWQESVFVHWIDPVTGVGGVHRLGHEPNALDGPSAALLCFVFDGAGRRFRRNARVPLEKAVGERDFVAGGTEWRVGGGGAPTIEVHEPGIDLVLQMEDFYPLTDFFPPSGKLVDEFAKHHYETSGRVTGTVTIDGQATEVNGLCHRDHSWGTRIWDSLLTHRWVSGTFGPHLSFGSMAWHAVDDSTVNVGYVVRNGLVTLAESIDVVTHMEIDGISHRGGTVTWRFADGESLTLECEAVEAVVAQNHEATWVDTECLVRHNGEVGMCDFEISSNPRGGTRQVAYSVRAALHDGLLSS